MALIQLGAAIASLAVDWEKTFEDEEGSYTRRGYIKRWLTRGKSLFNATCLLGLLVSLLVISPMFPDITIAKDGDASLEIRWILDGPLPDETNKWFRSLPIPQGPPEKPQIHTYLAARDAPYVGVKFREDELEIKLKESSTPIKALNGDLKGKAEVWRKWDWKLKEPAASKGKKSVAVIKDRKQKTDGACSIEITKLQIGDKGWWTLAFIINSDKPQASDLVTCVDKNMKSYQSNLPEGSRSLSYPEWLLKVLDEDNM